MSNESSILMAQRLKELRKEKNISHVSLSNAIKEKYGIEISRDSLMSYEVSDPNHTKAYKNEGMRVEYLRCLADFYGVSADYLLGFTNDRYRQPCAVDQLGLTNRSIWNMRLHCSVGDEIQGLNSLLESVDFLLLLPKITKLSTIIMDETKRINQEADEISVSEHDANHGMSVGAQLSSLDYLNMGILADQLCNLHPELSGRVAVLYGDRFIQAQMEEIKSDFDFIIKIITGYFDLLKRQRELRNDYGEY